MEVVIFSTASLDGRIATRTGDSKLSCEHDLRLLHEWRCWADIVLVGARTAIVDNPGLFVKRYPCRRQPLRGVVDGSFRVPHNLRLFTEMPWLSVIITSIEGIRRNQWKYKYLLSKGVKIVIADDKKRMSMKKVINKLNELGIRKVLVEGGGGLNWSLIKDDVVDKLEITYVGKVLGNGTQVVEGEGFSTVAEAPSFVPESIRVCECGQCVHISWRRLS